MQQFLAALLLAAPLLLLACSRPAPADPAADKPPPQSQPATPTKTTAPPPTTQADDELDANIKSLQALVTRLTLAVDGNRSRLEHLKNADDPAARERAERIYQSSVENLAKARKRLDLAIAKHRRRDAGRPAAGATSQPAETDARQLATVVATLESITDQLTRDVAAKKARLDNLQSSKSSATPDAAGDTKLERARAEYEEADKQLMKIRRSLEDARHQLELQKQAESSPKDGKH